MDAQLSFISVYGHFRKTQHNHTAQHALVLLSEALSKFQPVCVRMGTKESVA